ncbi:hypothetical protein AB0D10_01240 [Kitasatospora sp. NPDC048545]|uniref:hypothetical protein n=1 Tax=Kitasatospora sp. NPDC048545 TaxID=3157208 RepID=UPI0033F58A2D
MPTLTPPRTSRLAELLADGDPGPLGAEVRSLLGLADDSTAQYAAGVAECATFAVWEATRRSSPYREWLKDLPEPFLHTLLTLTADAADDQARALRMLALCTAMMRTVATQIGH